MIYIFEKGKAIFLLKKLHKKNNFIMSSFIKKFDFEKGKAIFFILKGNLHIKNKLFHYVFIYYKFYNYYYLRRIAITPFWYQRKLYKKTSFSWFP